jgi:hypothetical protein
VVLSRPCGGSLLVGVKRALAFVAPRRGEKRTKQAGLMTAGWVMHEYRVAAAALHKNVSTTYRLLLPYYPTTLLLVAMVCFACNVVASLCLFGYLQLFCPPFQGKKNLGHYC